jgi:hypothetical protein
MIPTIERTNRDNESNNNENEQIRRSDRIKNMKINGKMINTYSETINTHEDELHTHLNGTTSNGEVNKNVTSNENNEKDNTSAVTKHQKEKNHKIDWKNTQIVWTDNEPHKLLIKESLIIKTYEPELNRTTHSIPLYIYPNGVEKRFLPEIKRESK